MRERVKYAAFVPLWQNAYQGDTMPGRKLSFSIPLPGYSVKLVIRSSLRSVTKEMALGSGLDGSNLMAGELRIPAWKVELRPGKYDFEIEFTSPLGRVRSWLYGSFLIVDDIVK